MNAINEDEADETFRRVGVKVISIFKDFQNFHDNDNWRSFS